MGRQSRNRQPPPRMACSAGIASSGGEGIDQSYPKQRHSCQPQLQAQWKARAVNHTERQQIPPGTLVPRPTVECFIGKSEFRTNSSSGRSNLQITLLYMNKECLGATAKRMPHFYILSWVIQSYFFFSTKHWRAQLYSDGSFTKNLSTQCSFAWCPSA